ncbi:MAG: 3-deoxy-D-manno-octulosonic acid transferase [Bacteroidales bacterium]|nr:3-deoxy-D-manno-octulosonic acid transferase [Bacteroidales bacterium]
MSTLYTLSILLYGLGIRIAALFNPKAGKWVQGRKGLFRKLDNCLKNKEGDWKGNVWFHCASLGEFEQGRPVIEGFRALYPEYRIILTFFSPSGYEVRSGYEGAEGIFYMPLDTPLNARKWIRRLNPKLVFFVKYEYWFNFLKALNQKRVPVFIISARFHENQPFFKSYGSWFKKQLNHISWFFLQGEETQKLAEVLGIKNFTMTGDTRFDRVWSIREQRRTFPLIEQFTRDAKLFLGGSTWGPDEALILDLFRQNLPDLKFIIAPHEVHPSRIEALVNSWQLAVGSLQFAQGTEHRIEDHGSRITDRGSAVVRYSQLTTENAASARVIIVDSIGILAHLYQYASFSYIGGGFGVGIHNILEAAAFGHPVLFGPNFRKFTEARDLIRLGGAFPVGNAKELSSVMKDLLTSDEEYRRISSICMNYVESNCGATRRILQGIQTLGFIAVPKQNS